MSLIANNPYGLSQSHEAQRLDLWQLDVSPVLDYLLSLDQSFFMTCGLDKSDLPTKEELQVSAQRGTFPVNKISPVKVIQDTVPRNFPGRFEPLDSFRVDFIHPIENSIFTFLQSWRILVRVGRQGETGEVAPPLPDSTFQPVFKFDTQARFLCGTSDGSTLGYSQVLLIKGTWLKGYQQGEINKAEKAAVHLVTAQLQAGQIIPIS
jgi:hypothetical protein